MMPDLACIVQNHGVGWVEIGPRLLIPACRRMMVLRYDAARGHDAQGGRMAAMLSIRRMPAML
jgi:hypothetical protein